MSGWRNGRICRKRFLLYPDIEIANFKQRDRDNSNAHSVYVYIMLMGQPMLYPYALYIFQCENIVSSFISCEAFGDARILMSRTSLTLSFYSYSCLTADFGDLQAQYFYYENI